MPRFTPHQNMRAIARVIFGMSLAFGPAAGFNIGGVASVLCSKSLKLRAERRSPDVYSRTCSIMHASMTTSSSRRFEFVPYGEAYSGNEKSICADGLVQGADLHLTHWTNNQTPQVFPSVHTAFAVSAIQPEAAHYAPRNSRRTCRLSRHLSLSRSRKLSTNYCGMTARNSDVYAAQCCGSELPISRVARSGRAQQPFRHRRAHVGVGAT